MTKEKGITLKCDCHGDAIEFIYKKDYNEQGEMDVVLWRHSLNSAKLCFRDRLRWCFHILRTGMPWTDYIILTDKNIKKLKSYINSLGL